MSNTNIRDYLLRRGWRLGVIQKHGCYTRVEWSHPDVGEEYPQWEALRIERMKNPKVRARMKIKAEKEHVPFVYDPGK